LQKYIKIYLARSKNNYVGYSSMTIMLQKILTFQQLAERLIIDGST